MRSKRGVLIAIDLPKPDHFEVNHIPVKSYDGIYKIQPSRLHELLTQREFSIYEYVIVVDTRYVYEFDGGHIKNAWNILNMNQLCALLEDYRSESICIIFHCEHSTVRGPHAYKKFRDTWYEHFRKEFKHLDIFLLDRGYKNYFEEYPCDCDGAYIPMRSDPYNTNGTLRKCFEEFCEGFDYRSRDQKAKICSVPSINFEYDNTDTDTLPDVKNTLPTLF